MHKAKERLNGGYMNIERLRTSKENALNLYKLAKAEFMATITKENIKGDSEKWKIFCERKADCMRLGIRI